MPQDRVPADFYEANQYAAEASVGYLMRRVLLSLTQQTGKLLEPVCCVRLNSTRRMR